MKLLFTKDDLYIISWESNFDDFPPNTEQQIIPNDSPTHFDEQDAIITDLDLRSTRRQENTDAADSDSHSREVAEADLRSARRQTNTESDNSDQYARTLPNEDRQSDRRQQNTELGNDDLANRDFPTDGNSDFSNIGGNDTTVPDVLIRN